MLNRKEPNHFFILAIATFCILFSTETEGQHSFTEADEMNVSPVEGIDNSPTSPISDNNAVWFFRSSQDFNNAVSCDPGMTMRTEYFNSSRIAPGQILNCGTTGVMASALTNDNCYAPNDLLPGFNLEPLMGSSGYLVLGNGAFGILGYAAGANSYDDDNRFNFTIPVRAVSFEMITPFGVGGQFAVDVFGAGGLLGGGAIYMGNGTTPVFVGITTLEDIVAVEVFYRDRGTGTAPQAELFTSLSFGCVEVPAIPTFSQWGLIILGCLLSIVGLVAIRQTSAAFS